MTVKFRLTFPHLNLQGRQTPMVSVIVSGALRRVPDSLSAYLLVFKAEGLRSPKQLQKAPSLTLWGVRLVSALLTPLLSLILACLVCPRHHWTACGTYLVLLDGNG